MSNVHERRGPTDLWLPTIEESQSPPTQTWADLEVKYSEVCWVFNGYIAVGQTTMVVGPPAMGKSFLMLSWIKTIMDGGEWPDGSQYTQPIQGAMILWVETEGGEPLNIPRARRMGIDTSRVCTIHNESTDGNPVNLMARADLDMISSIAGYHKVVAIVVDSLSGGHNANENETGAGKVVQSITQIARKVNKPLLLAHHVNKQGFATDAPSMAHVRGSGSQLQYPRIVVQLDSPDPSRPEAKRVTCTKNNLMHTPIPFGFVMSESGPVWCEAPIPQQRERKSEIRTLRDTKVIEMVRAGASYRKISESQGISPATVSNIVAKATNGLRSEHESENVEEVETVIPNDPVDTIIEMPL